MRDEVGWGAPGREEMGGVKSQTSGVDLGRIVPFCNSRALEAKVQVIVSPRTSVSLA